MQVQSLNHDPFDNFWTGVLNCAANALICDQARFESSEICLKTMKTMGKTSSLAMLPDFEIFCVDLTEGIFIKLHVLLICSNQW